ncbi:hypothetical protein PMAYCL1PPCAC_23604, partial [Pristionchus mayeri]
MKNNKKQVGRDNEAFLTSRLIKQAKAHIVVGFLLRLLLLSRRSSSGGSSSSRCGRGGSRPSGGYGRELLLSFADQISDSLTLEGFNDLVGLLHVNILTDGLYNLKDVLSGRGCVASEVSEEISSEVLHYLKF